MTNHIETPSAIDKKKPNRAHTKYPRNTDPRKRDVKRAETTPLHVATLAMAYWEIAEILESVCENVPLHNSQQKVNKALMFKCRQQAKSLDIAYGKKDCFRTYHDTELLYDALKEDERRKLAKKTAMTTRSHEQIRFS